MKTLASLACASLLAASVAAQGPNPVVYTWDAQPFVPGIQGGDGSWKKFGGFTLPGLNDQVFFRYDPATGISMQTYWSSLADTQDSLVVFGTTPGTVLLFDSVDAERLRFDVSGYVISGGANWIRAREIEIAAGIATLDLILNDVPLLTKKGNGALLLKGDGHASWIGALAVQSGSVFAFPGTSPTLLLTGTQPADALDLPGGSEVGVNLTMIAAGAQTMRVTAPGTAKISSSWLRFEGGVDRTIDVSAGSTLEVTSQFETSSSIGTSQIVKTGAGDLRLRGPGHLSSKVVVNEGRLFAENLASAIGFAPIVVNSELGGFGPLHGTLDLKGRLSPGTPDNALGSLSVRSLTLEPGSRLVLDIGATSSDRIAIEENGVLSVAGPVTVELHDVGGLTPGCAVELLDANHAATVAGLSPASFQLVSPVGGSLGVVDGRLYFFAGVPSLDLDGNGMPDAAEMYEGDGARAIHLGGYATIQSTAATFPVLGSFTLETWARPVDAAADFTLVSKLDFYDGSFEFHSAAGRLAFDFRSGGMNHYFVSDAIVVQPARWQHFALSFDAATATPTLFRNGAPIPGHWLGSAASSVPSGSKGFSVVLGYSPIPKQGFGSLGEARIWTAVRTPSQIASVYKARLAGTEPGLLAYWRMEEGTGVYLTNGVTGAQDAVITNTAATWYLQATDLNANGVIDVHEPATLMNVTGGCGIAGSPQLVTGLPKLGTTMHFSIAGVQPNSYVILALSAGPAVRIPLGGCILQVNPGTVVAQLSGISAPDGTLALDLPIPFETWFFGMQVAGQAFALAAGGPGLGVCELTNGIEMRVGF